MITRAHVNTYRALNVVALSFKRQKEVLAHFLYDF